jgi:hypothetical protein
MAKVERGITPKRDWLKEAETLGLAYNVDGLLALYQDAVAARVPADVLAQIKDYGSAARG